MKSLVKKILQVYKQCRIAKSNFISVYLKFVYYKMIYNKNILAHQNTVINNAQNIICSGKLNIGVQYVGFSHPNDRTVLNIQGKLFIKHNYSIGRGCRFDIAKNAIVRIGKGGYVNVNTKFIIMHKLEIGDNCVIAWDCQFLDEDFHSISYDNKKPRKNEICIGNNVWIGAGAKIYKGTTIADGCVIASNSIVRGGFLESNSLIGGNPAMLIKKDINWV